MFFQKEFFRAWPVGKKKSQAMFRRTFESSPFYKRETVKLIHEAMQMDNRSLTLPG